MSKFKSFTAGTLMLALVAAGAGLRSAVAGEPTLAAAIGLLQGGDAAGAAQALTVITIHEPGNAQAWRLLGTARQQLHAYDLAISAYQHALRIEPDSPRVYYSMGTTYAAKHDAGQAFEWLGRAAATRRYDMTQISDDAVLADLRGDPRFAALLPTPVVFEQPFVEKVKWR